MKIISITLLLVLLLCSYLVHSWPEPAENDEDNIYSNAIVKIEGREQCTGILIAPDMVITASHCGFHEPEFRNDTNVYWSEYYPPLTVEYDPDTFCSNSELAYVPRCISALQGDSPYFGLIRGGRKILSLIYESYTANLIAIEGYKHQCAQMCNGDFYCDAWTYTDRLLPSSGEYRGECENFMSESPLGLIHTDRCSFSVDHPSSCYSGLKYQSIATVGHLINGITIGSINSYYDSIDELESVDFPSNCIFQCDSIDDCDGWNSFYRVLSSTRVIAQCNILRRFNWRESETDSIIKFGASEQIEDYEYPWLFQTTNIATSMAGFEDIILLKLTEPVPTDIAQPVKVLTTLPPWYGDDGSYWLSNQSIEFSGWGTYALDNNHRKTITGGFESMGDEFDRPNIFNFHARNGVSSEHGDSGGPVYTLLPSNTGSTPERYLLGVNQGRNVNNTSRYIKTFGTGGLNLLGEVHPNVSNWIDRALYNNRYEFSLTVPLYNWWRQDRRDYFITTDPRWSVFPDGLIWYGNHVYNQKFKDNYRMFRVEGEVFSPYLPQPESTVPFFNWWSSNHLDNKATSDPDWLMDLSSIIYSGEHILNGPTQDSYTLYRLEGYIYDPAFPQPEETKPLYSYYSRTHNEYMASTQFARSMELTWMGITYKWINPNPPSGFEAIRLEGYVLDLTDH